MARVKSAKTFSLAEGTMEYSQMYVFVLLIPVVLQILFPLAILTGFSLLRLSSLLFNRLVRKEEQLTGATAAAAQ
jgi:hypothetical protein